MASKDQKSLLEAYSKILGEENEAEQKVEAGNPATTSMSDLLDANPELGGHAKTPLANAPTSEVKNALKELMRYKRPNHPVDDEVIYTNSDEQLESLQDFLDKQLNHAKISQVASESVDTSSYLRWMR